MERTGISNMALFLFIKCVDKIIQMHEKTSVLLRNNFVAKMWRHLGKLGLWIDTKNRLWSDTACSKQHLIRAWTFCLIWASAGNTFLAFFTVRNMYIMNINMLKRLIWENTVCSFISRVSSDDFTFQVRSGSTFFLFFLLYRTRIACSRATVKKEWTKCFSW